jgi:hypothetical protein
MYVNGKVVAIETLPGMEGRIKESDGGVNSRMIYFIYWKNFYKYYNILSV